MIRIVRPLRTGNIFGGVLTSSLPLQPPLCKHFLVFRRVLRLHLVLWLVAILGVVAAPLLSMHEVERHTLGSEQDTTCTHSRRHDAIFFSTGTGETLPAPALMSRVWVGEGLSPNSATAWMILDWCEEHTQTHTLPTHILPTHTDAHATDAHAIYHESDMEKDNTQKQKNLRSTATFVASCVQVARTAAVAARQQRP